MARSADVLTTVEACKEKKIWYGLHVQPPQCLLDETAKRAKGFEMIKASDAKYFHITLIYNKEMTPAEWDRIDGIVKGFKLTGDDLGWGSPYYVQPSHAKKTGADGKGAGFWCLDVHSPRLEAVRDAVMKVFLAPDKQLEHGRKIPPHVTVYTVKRKPEVCGVTLHWAERDSFQLTRYLLLFLIVISVIYAQTDGFTGKWRIGRHLFPDFHADVASTGTAPA